MRVMYDTRERHFDQNPYLSLLRDSVAPDVKVIGFSWSRALLGRYDLVHVHWPEFVLRPGPRWLHPVAAAAMRLWLLRLKLSHTPVIRTMHDLEPLVGVAPAEVRLLGELASIESARVWLTDPSGLPHAPSIAPGDAVIPHGDYLPWLAEQVIEQRVDVVDAAHVPSTLLCFGILRPYKHFEQVICAVEGLPEDVTAHLRVLGAAPEPDYLVTLFEAAGAAPARVEIVARRAADRELAEALAAADVVVVPYEQLYNSGVILLALSAQRPVALRDSVIARRLQAEFGPGWVSLWPGDLDADKLTEVLAQVRAPRPALNLESSRGWESVGARHRAFYAEILGEPAPTTHLIAVRHGAQST